MLHHASPRHDVHGIAATGPDPERAATGESPRSPTPQTFARYECQGFVQPHTILWNSSTFTPLMGPSQSDGWVDQLIHPSDGSCPAQVGRTDALPAPFFPSSCVRTPWSRVLECVCVCFLGGCWFVSLVALKNVFSISGLECFNRWHMDFGSVQIIDNYSVSRMDVDVYGLSRAFRVRDEWFFS